MRRGCQPNSRKRLNKFLQMRYCPRARFSLVLETSFYTTLNLTLPHSEDGYSLGEIIPDNDHSLHRDFANFNVP